MSNKSVAPAEQKSFRPECIGRVIETAAERGRPTLDHIGLMAADELERLAGLPAGPSRDLEIADTLRTVEDVLRAKRARRAASRAPLLLKLRDCLRKMLGRRP